MVTDNVAASTFAYATASEASDNQVKPKVTIKQCTVENNTVSCSIVPEDAVECAWYYYIQGEAQPSAQELLAGGKGVRIAPGTETKIDYDPCPAGYRVPTYDDLSDLLSIEEKDYDIAKGGFYMTQNGTTTWWQGSGNRDYKGFLTVLGYTFAWSSATEIYPDGHFSYRFVLNDDWGCFAGIGNRTFAQSIRCVAE